MMIRKRAAKAKVVAAFTLHCWHDLVEISLLHSTLHSVHAVRRRTPLKIFLVVYVGTHEKLVVAVGEVGCNEKVK